MTGSVMVAELILALDVATPDDAYRLLDQVPACRWVKVGPVLTTRWGSDLVPRLVDRGIAVFLDQKWHDIPNTVAGAVVAAADLGVSMATVHALGGPAMLEAAAGAAPDGLALVAVTVLTSHTAEGFSGVLGRPAAGLDTVVEAVRLGRTALAAGVDGVVSSVAEAAALRAALGPDALLVTPGIRRGTDAKSDQARTASAAAAAAAGASHLVVGRPILTAQDPAAAFRGFLEEMTCAEQPR